MSGGKSYRIFSELGGTLSDHRDFYREILDQVEAGGPALRPADPDSNLEVEVQDSGETEVRLTFPIDNNSKVEDGRLLLEDKFLLDFRGEFKSYQRQFKLLGDFSEEDPLEKQVDPILSFHRVVKDKVPDENRVRNFVKEVISVRPKGLSEADQELFKPHVAFFKEAQDHLQKLKPQWILKLGHPKNFYTVAEKSGLKVFTLRIVAEASEAGEPPEGKRIYLRERFFVDAKTGVYRGHQRSWDYARSTLEDNEIEGLIESLREGVQPESRSAAALFEELLPLWRSASPVQPLTKDHHQILGQNREYLNSLVKLLKINPAWNFKANDPSSNLQVVTWGEGKEIILNLWFEDGVEVSPSQVQLREHFYLDDQGKLLDHRRQWILPAELREDRQHIKYIKILNEKGLPPVHRTQALVDDLRSHLPEIQKRPKVPVLTMDQAMDKIVKKYQGTQGEAGWSLAPRKWDGLQDADRQQNNLQTLYFIRTLESERIGQRLEESKSWISKDRGYDPASDLENLQLLMEKASVQAAQHPNLGVQELLVSLGLDPEVGKLARRLAQDKLTTKIFRASQDPDPDIRSQRLMNLATHRLWDQGFTGTAVAMAEVFKNDSQVGHRASQLTSLVEGEGSWGSQVEFVAPKLLKELGHPVVVAGMTVAPIVGVASRAKLVQWLGTRHLLARAGTSLGSLLGEATAFTGTVNVGNSLQHNSERVWKDLPQQIASATLLFGLMRFLHLKTGKLKVRMAEGEIHPALGGRAPAKASYHWTQSKYWTTPKGSSRPYFPTTPRGEVLTSPTPAYNALTPLGETGAALLEHSSGMASMWFTQAVTHPFLSHVPNYDWRGGILEAGLGYFNALAGSSLANGMTGGRLHLGLAQVRMGLESYDLPRLSRSMEGEKQAILQRLTSELKDLNFKLENKANLEGEAPKDFGFPVNLSKLLPGFSLSRDRISLRFEQEGPEGKYRPVEETYQQVLDAVGEKHEDSRVERLISQLKEIEIDPPQIETKETLEGMDGERLGKPSGAFLGTLTGPEGALEIRLNELSHELYDAEGKLMGEAWGAVEGGETHVVIQAAEGAELWAEHPNGRWEGPMDYVLLKNFPRVQLGSTMFTFTKPSSASGVAWEHVPQSGVFSADPVAPEDPARIGLDPTTLAPGREPPKTGRNLGYQAWLRFESVLPETGIAKEVPAEIVEQKQPWATFQLSEGVGEVNQGSQNFFLHPRIVIGESYNGHLGPGVEAFNTILPKGVLAWEHALIYLDTHHHLNLVRLDSADPAHSVYLDGKELDINQPKRVYGDSTIQLKGSDGKFYDLEISTHDSLPLGQKPKADTFAGLEAVDTTSVESGVQAAARKKAEQEARLREAEVALLAGQAAQAKGRSEAELERLPEDPGVRPAEPEPGPQESLEKKEESGEWELEVEVESEEGLKPPIAQGPGRFDLPGEGEVSAEDSARDPFAELAKEMAVESEAPESTGPAAGETPEPPTVPGLPEPFPSGKKMTDQSFGPELDKLRAQWLIKNGEDPLENAEPILDGDGKVAQIMEEGRVRKVVEVLNQLKAGLRMKGGLIPPPSLEEIWGEEAAILRQKYLEQFPGQDPFFEAEPIRDVEGKVIKVQVNDKEFDMDFFLRRMAFEMSSALRQQKLKVLKSQRIQMKRFEQLEETWQEVFTGKQEPFSFFDPNKYKKVYEGKILVAIADSQKGKEIPLDQWLDRRELFLEEIQPEALRPLEEPTVDSGELELPEPKEEDSLKSLMHSLEAMGVQLKNEEIDLEVGDIILLDKEPPPLPPTAQGEKKISDAVWGDPAGSGLIDLEAAQKAYEQGKRSSKTVGETYEDLSSAAPKSLMDLVSPDLHVVNNAFQKAKFDINYHPDRILKSQKEKIRGRVHDVLGFLDQVQRKVQEGPDRPYKEVAQGIINNLQDLIPRRFHPTQDYTIESDGRQMRFSTFLTGETKSVGGDVGEPVGNLVISFRAGMNPRYMIHTVLEILNKAQVPIEVIFPLEYPREGTNYIGVRYSGEHIGEAYGLVEEVVRKYSSVFSDNKIFLSDPVEFDNGEPWPGVGHFSYRGASEKFSLESLKMILAKAWKEARALSKSDPPDPEILGEKIKSTLREVGWW